MDTEEPTPPLTWSAPQRRVLLVLLSLLCLGLGIRYTCNPVYVSDPPPERAPRYADLADKVDPNTADWQTLAVLPAIGESRAKEIIAYRERKRAEDPNQIVFDAPGDLLYVHGIGPALIEAMKPYLSFPTTQPETRPIP
jgi:hypothetical protein